jgi:predicted ATPase
MITSIRIDDNKKTPFKYIQKIKAFKNGSEFIFKPGVNVIVGKNGSGKSTLLNMISKYMLCEKKMCSELPSEALYFPDIFDDDKVLDGISIKSDYIGKVFHLLQQTEMRKDDILDNINNLSLYMNGASRSSGEKNLHAMNSLFDFVFNQDEYAFPIQKLMEFKKKSNEFWANRIDNLLKYYKDNHVVLMEKDFEYTIIMDEPDRNLDIDNIMDLYKVLSFHKPQTQIIAVIHNPALIYKLSKLDCVNFIEMTKGYLKKITGFMNKKIRKEMREELRTIGSKGRHVFTATFVRFGFRNGYIGPVKTMLLQDVTLDSKIVSDHLWFDLTKGFSGADLSPGDVVEFCARVSAYEKGYKGHKDDVLNRPIERDYRLSRPTKIKKIGKKLILKDEGK